MNQLQMEMGLIPAKILKEDKEDPSIFRRWMTGLMIRNLRHDIDAYLESVSDEKGGEKTTKSREKILELLSGDGSLSAAAALQHPQITAPW